MQKFGEFVCKHKRIILIIMLILLIPSIIGMKATRINYDILVYLPDDIETIQGENILSEDFNMGAFSIILLEDMETKDILKLEDEMKSLSEEITAFASENKENQTYIDNLNTDIMDLKISVNSFNLSIGIVIPQAVPYTFTSDIL